MTLKPLQPAALLGVLVAILAACGGGTFGPLRSNAAADGTPSPVAGSSVSQDANQRAESTMNREVTYGNAQTKGPRLIVLPGQIKSSNADFLQQVSATSIADYGELELTRANFTVLERSSLGPLLQEMELAYNLGDPHQAQRVFKKGRLQTTRWIVKFDVLKVEAVAQASSGFDGAAVGQLIDIYGGGSKASQAGSTAARSVKTDQAAKVWVVGMRYKVLDASSTEQVANGYFEDKLEAGQAATSVLGISTGVAGQLSLDSLVQRLVQKSVVEIDAKYK